MLLVCQEKAIISNKEAVTRGLTSTRGVGIGGGRGEGRGGEGGEGEGGGGAHYRPRKSMSQATKAGMNRYSGAVFRVLAIRL